jgi:hypothetical protein
VPDGEEAEEPDDERDGVRLSRTRVVKAFRGEIEGESTGELAGISGQVRIDNLPDGGQVLTLDYEPG